MGHSVDFDISELDTEIAPLAPAIDVTPQQAEALDKIQSWYHADNDEQVFRLFGYAGTGKTTLARIIVESLDLSDVRFAAYTGKAAYVLRSKGAADASTVHSLIYTPVEKAELRAQLTKLKTQLEDTTDPDETTSIRRQVDILEDKILSTPAFALKENSDLDQADLVVLDEVSMVGTQMAHDLLSFGVKLLVLGDPAQLPPVDGGGYFIHADPDHLLTEIHRSALDSPVTRIATAVRQSPTGDRDLGISGLDGASGRRPRLTRDHLAETDQVLCGTNRTRWNLIHQIRDMQGLRGTTPLPGDRIIVLANNREAGVFNGQLFTVAACRPDDKSPDILSMLVLDDEGGHRFINVWACGFENVEGEKLAKRNGRSRIVAATFGQAITCHKSQGSQWGNVLVVDESSVFAHIARKENAQYGANNADELAHLAAKRWLYTGVTRAAERIVIVPRER